MGATSGGTFLPTHHWGRLDGRMAVAELEHHDLVLLRFDPAGRLLDERHAVRNRGRLRTAVVAPDGSLLVTTDDGDGRRRPTTARDDGDGRDVVLRARPRR